MQNTECFRKPNTRNERDVEVDLEATEPDLHQAKSYLFTSANLPDDYSGEFKPPSYAAYRTDIMKKWMKYSEIREGSDKARGAYVDFPYNISHDGKLLDEPTPLNVVQIKVLERKRDKRTMGRHTSGQSSQTATKTSANQTRQDKKVASSPEEVHHQPPALQTLQHLEQPPVVDMPAQPLLTGCNASKNTMSNPTGEQGVSSFHQATQINDDYGFKSTNVGAGTAKVPERSLTHGDDPFHLSVKTHRKR